MFSVSSFITDAVTVFVAVAVMGAFLVAAVVAGIEFWVYCTYVQRRAKKR